MTLLAKCVHSTALAAAVADAVVAYPKARMPAYKSFSTSAAAIPEFLLPNHQLASRMLNAQPGASHGPRRAMLPRAGRALSAATQQQQPSLLRTSRWYSSPTSVSAGIAVALQAASARNPRRVAFAPQHTGAHARPFATTHQAAQTQTLLNPQLDEDGKEMRLEITPRAAKRLSQVMDKDRNPYLALRIQVESGGCHGFQYLMSLVTLPDTLPSTTGERSADVAIPADAASSIGEDDTIFTFALDGTDASATAADPLSAPKIILDTPSLELLNGSKVDFTTELIGSQFKIVDNPLATSSCGCGTSFDIKI